MSLPEPTPAEKTLRRVLLISAIDGWSVIILAGLAVPLALLLGDLSGLVVVLAVAAGGIIELRGRGRLVRRDATGMKLLIRAQMFILAVILVYCATRLGSFDEGLVQDAVRENLTPEMEATLQESGIERSEIVPAVKLMFYTIYGLFAFLSIVFQGGLCLYYRSRVGKVDEALATPPSPSL